MRDEVAELRERVASQRSVIEALEARLTRMEREETPVHGVRTEAQDRRDEPAERLTDRRHLLTEAAGVAAGAVVGGAALAITDASPAAAAPGTFDGNPAVTATAVPAGGVAVFATADDGIAVNGQSTNGYGVFGVTSGGHSLIAYTREGTHLVLGGNPGPPPASTVNRKTGSVVKDANNDLWCCVAEGTPGTWRKLSGPGTSGALHTLPTPVRVYDSRPGFPPATGVKAPLVANTARSCDLKANSSGVPAGATAALVSLTVTNTTGAGGGFLAVYRSGIAWPGTSNLNWSGPNQNVAVTTLTAVDANASCNLYASQATHVVVDVIAYYR